MAMVAEFLVSKLQEALFDLAKEEIARQLGLVEDVNKLQSTLEQLQGYLQDAEKKSIEDASTNLWLNQIKDVVYDIEDLLEEYATLTKVDDSEKSISSREDKSSSFSTKVSCNFSIILSCFKKAASKHTISVQIQCLNKKLKDQIMNQIPILGLMKGSEANHQMRQNQLPAHTMHSVVIRSDIVGNRIHDDARRLVELLTQEDNRDNPLVYAVVGMGGMGKTTLAKLVFDDQRIASRFEINAWVSVSQNYSEIDILRTITSSAGGDAKPCHSLNLLSEQVKDMVQGKRLFMVLDDVWETERVWKGVLRSLLKRGAAKGSRVLVTTRNKEVADQMMAVHSHQVHPLHQEDGWLLLCKSAFPAWEQQEAKDNLWNLKDIGEEIVKKCDGLPLAINVIGGILSAKSRTREAWELVLKSSLWKVNGLPKEIHSALYMSYQYLPTNIKQCFLYCSLFPKGRYFSAKRAQNLWIQEGFIKDELNVSFYDVAESYLRILVQKNLLKFDPRRFSEFFTMHDLFYSLSQFLMQNESLVSTAEEYSNYHSSARALKLRRLSVMCGSSDKTTNNFPKSLKDQTSLRSLLFFDKSICKIDNDIFNHLRRLRILWLQGTNVTDLPESLGALKLLRYLNLSETPISKLPKTIGKLKSLRILDVSHCSNLRNFPSSVMNLQHLCSISTRGSALNYLPPGLGRLNELQNLDFIIPDIGQESSVLEDLGALNQLRSLSLCYLERVLDRSQAKAAALKEKQHLRALELACSGRDFNEVLMLNQALEPDCSKRHFCEVHLVLSTAAKEPELVVSKSEFDEVLMQNRALEPACSKSDSDEVSWHIQPPGPDSQTSDFGEAHDLPVPKLAGSESDFDEVLMQNRACSLARFSSLWNLERVLDRSQAKSAALKEKQHLRALELDSSKRNFAEVSWHIQPPGPDSRASSFGEAHDLPVPELAGSESDFDEVLMQNRALEPACSKSDSGEVLLMSEESKDSAKKIEEIFEDLCPPLQLQFLKITNYDGSKLPSWLGHASFNSLLTLSISGCWSCKQLNGIGVLPNLEKLSINDASSIKTIGVEFYTDNSRSNVEIGSLEPPYKTFVFLPRIIFVSFKEMDSWEEWSCLGNAIPVMPRLEILQILKCPMLKSFPEELLHHAAASLRKIRICDAGKLLLKAVQNLSHLESLVIENIPNLEGISGLPALEHLEITHCPGIKLVELTHRLQLVSWKDFDTDSLPEWFSIDGHGYDNKLNASFLEISCKEELVSKICFKEEYEWSKIQHLDNVDVWNENRRLRLAYRRNLGSFTVYPDEKQEETSQVEWRSLN